MGTNSKLPETIAANSENSVYNIRRLPKIREDFLSRFNRYYALLAALSVLYCVLILVIPPDASVLRRYDITTSQAQWLSVSFALPLIVIWFAAFYGFIKLKKYAAHAKPDRDGIWLAKVAHGLMFLALAMPLNSIFTALGNYLTSRRPQLTPLTVITNNYLALILVLAGFYLIYQGTGGLVSLLNKRQRYSSYERPIMLMFLLISIIYSYVTLTNEARQFPVAGIRRAAYYMADFPLILTIIIPYLFVWFFGLRSVYFIYLYRRRVKGILYRESLGLLASGLAVVIVTSMIIRYLVSMTATLNNLTLRFLLVFLYVLLLVIFAGYLLIAQGAKKMQRIEEV